MSLSKHQSNFLLLLITLFFASAHATRFDITNNCNFTIWAATLAHCGNIFAGGKQINPGGTWSLEVSPGTQAGSIWARTGCSFNGSGHGSCQTGDCGGVLQCQDDGAPPRTLASYWLNEDKDFFEISLVEGYNVPMEFSPTSNGCTGGIKCTADINGQCPRELKAPGGCNNPCTVFKTNQYCCNSGSCGPTNYSTIFSKWCPTAYSYPLDDPTNTLTCPRGTNYKIVFCP